MEEISQEIIGYLTY